jgi:hypothetical protein
MPAQQRGKVLHPNARDLVRITPQAFARARCLPQQFIDLIQATE